MCRSFSGTVGLEDAHHCLFTPADTLEQGWACCAAGKAFSASEWLGCEGGQGSSALLFFILSVFLWGSTKDRLCAMVELVVCFGSKVVVCLTGTWAL